MSFDKDSVERFKTHPMVFLCTFAAAAFAFGFGFEHTRLKLLGYESVKESTYIKKEEAVSRIDHDRALDELRKKLDKHQGELDECQNDRRQNYVRISDLPLEFRGDPQFCIRRISGLLARAPSFNVDQFNDLFRELAVFRRNNGKTTQNMNGGNKDKSENRLKFDVNLSEFLSMLSVSYPDNDRPPARTVAEKLIRFQIICGEISDAKVGANTWVKIELAHAIIDHEFRTRGYEATDTWKQKLRQNLFHQGNDRRSGTVIGK